MKKHLFYPIRLDGRTRKAKMDTLDFLWNSQREKSLRQEMGKHISVSQKLQERAQEQPCFEIL